MMTVEPSAGTGFNVVLQGVSAAKLVRLLEVLRG
jgi:hypothetical protein